jgi:hypothetical protein
MLEIITVPYPDPPDEAIRSIRGSSGLGQSSHLGLILVKFSKDSQYVCSFDIAHCYLAAGNSRLTKSYIIVG